MDAFVSILPVVRSQCRQHSKLNPRRVTVLLNGTNDLDRNTGLAMLIKRFNHFSKRSLAKKFYDRIYEVSVRRVHTVTGCYPHRSVNGVSGVTI